MRDEDLRLLAPAAQLPVAADQLQRRLVRLGAGVAEDHVVQRAGRELREARGEADRGLGGGVEEGRIEGDRLHLLGDGVGDLRAAIAHVRAPEAGEPVEELAARPRRPASSRAPSGSRACPPCASRAWSVKGWRWCASSSRRRALRSKAVIPRLEHDGRRAPPALQSALRACRASGAYRAPRGSGPAPRRPRPGRPRARGARLVATSRVRRIASVARPGLRAGVRAALGASSAGAARWRRAA